MDFLASQHGDEPYGAKVKELMDLNPLGLDLSNMGIKIGNLPAYRKGQRYEGIMQIQACYGPGTTAEHFAAQENLEWLGGPVRNPFTNTMILLDLHSSYREDHYGAAFDFLRIGSYVPAAALGAAMELTGFRKVIVAPDSFSEATNAVVIEQSMEGPDEVDKYAWQTYEGLAVLGEFTGGDLVATYENAIMAGSLEFLGRKEIMIRDTDPAVLSYLESLNLNDTHLHEQAEFDLPIEAREHLGIPPDVRVLTGGEEYPEVTDPCPDLGQTANGVQRREFFRSIYYDVDPPRKHPSTDTLWNPAAIGFIGGVALRQQ